MFNSTKKSLSSVKFARRNSSDRTLKTMMAKRFHQWWLLQSYAERFFGTTSTNLVWKVCIFNRMALHVIRLSQSLLCVKYFLDASYRNLAISPDYQDRPIWHHQISVCGAISKERFISIVHSLSLLWKSTYRKKLPTFLPKHLRNVMKSA